MKKKIFYLLPVLSPYKLQIVSIVFYSILGMAGAFFQPLIIRNLTDQGILKQDYQWIVFCSILLVFIICFQQIIEIVQTYVLMKIRKKALHKLNVRAFEKLLNLKIEYFTNNNNAQIIDQLNTDISCVSILLDKAFFNMFVYMLKIVTGLAGLFYINWVMAVCIILCMPIKFFLLTFFSNKKEKLTSQSICLKKDFHAWMADRISGIREIKLSNRYEKECEYFSRRKTELLNYEQKSEFLNVENSSAEAFIYGVLTAIYYMLGGYFVCKGKMSLGSVLAFISYSGSVTAPISMVMNIKMIFAQIKPSFLRLEQFFQLEEEWNDASKALPGEIREIYIKNLSFCYGERQILKSVSLKIKAGERIAIVGENGSGKSTLLSVLLKLYLPCEGKIFVNQEDSENINLSEYRSLFSVVTQSPYLFQETIKENIDPYAEYTDDEICRIMGKLQMNSLLQHFPQGLNTVIGVEGANLSGGERQKIALLRAALKKSSILIFDESTSNFDKDSEEWLFSEGFEILKERMIIFVTHRLEYLKYFDRVYTIENCSLKEISKRKEG